MSRPFVFDALATLQALSEHDVSQPSQLCRGSTRDRLPATTDPNFSPTCSDYGKISGACEFSFCPPREVSQLSRLSREDASVDELSEDERCRFEERAAIIEYDAGMPRSSAERLALLEIQNSTVRAFGRD